MRSSSVLFVIGTRPEAIKLAPVYFALQRLGITPLVCGTFQGRELLAQALAVFGITVDITLDVMRPAQSLSGLTERLLSGMTAVLGQVNPAAVVVQGDTTTAFVAGLAAFYCGIPVAHIEAGLRTYNVHAPFPEEFNRRALTAFSDLHFAPTSRAAQNLIQEGILPERVFCVGNTVVDALQWVQNEIASGRLSITTSLRELTASKRRIVVLTLHRREASVQLLQRVCALARQFVEQHEDVLMVYPKHPNPSVASLGEQFVGSERVVVVPPVSYPEMVWLLTHAACVITDSGGIQEEAVSLGKRVVCVRELTERQEGVEVGLVRLTGFSSTRIFDALKWGLADDGPAQPLGVVVSPFGDGNAGNRIADCLVHTYALKAEGKGDDDVCSSKARC